MDCYSGFKWHNFRYMHVSRAIAQDHGAAYANGIVSYHTNAFTHGQEYVACLYFTSTCQQVVNAHYYTNSIAAKNCVTSENPGETFNIHSFDATSFRPVMIKLTVRGLRDNTELFQKEVHLMNKSTEIILDWINTDQLSFEAFSSPTSIIYIGCLCLS
jgi:hypothetical protein